jgi:hypothetical protein
MNKIVKGDKSEMKKDIEHFYGKEFVLNYGKFKNGDICLRDSCKVIYVDENKYFIYDQIKNTLSREGDKCIVKIFFEHDILDGGYGLVNISEEIQNVKKELHDGKVWNGYMFREDKYIKSSESNYFTGWFSEEIVSDEELTIQIIKKVNFGKIEDPEFPSLTIEV